MRRSNIIISALVWTTLVALGAYTLVRSLGDAAWATDEPVYRNAAVAIFDHGNWTHNLEHPPLGKLVIGLSIQVFGEPSAWAVRLPSALAMLLCGAVLAALAWRVTKLQGAAFATFATWVLLPHPDPSFDVGRLGYLDALMLLWCALALYAAWRWQEAWSRRWVVACGVAVGLALATKFTALFVLIGIPLLVIRRSDVAARRRYGQLALLSGVALVVALAPWLLLGRDLPHALRFALSMQLRDVQQTIVVAGHTYEDGAPIWTQLWWQWDAWPAFALAQLTGIVVAWWALPRRAFLLIAASIVVPFVAFAAGSRILPHWQVAWQLGVTLALGCSIGWLASRARASALMNKWLSGGLAAVLTFVVFAAVMQHANPAETSSKARSMRIAEALRDADAPGAIVVDVANARADRALVIAHPGNWNGTYHSAVDSQHDWATRDGGALQELEPEALRARAKDPSNITAIVAPADAPMNLLPVPSAELERAFDRIAVDGTDDVVWIRADRTQR